MGCRELGLQFNGNFIQIKSDNFFAAYEKHRDIALVTLFMNHFYCISVLWPLLQRKTRKFPKSSLSLSSDLRKTPPKRDALRHSGGDRRLWTSATVTLYFEVELSKERRPGTEQNTSVGFDTMPSRDSFWKGRPSALPLGSVTGPGGCRKKCRWAERWSLKKKKKKDSCCGIAFICLKYALLMYMYLSVNHQDLLCATGNLFLAGA